MFRSTIYDALRVCLAFVPCAFLILVALHDTLSVVTAAFASVAASSFLNERRRPALGLGVSNDRLGVALLIVSPSCVVPVILEGYGFLGRAMAISGLPYPVFRSIS